MTLLVWSLLVASPRVQLMTMGEAPALYARFGHAALRVTDGGSDLVYNFGTTDFSRPDLFRAFLRGHVRFWVSVSSFSQTVATYRGDDRTIWLQDLQLSDAQHERLAQRLRWQALPEHRDYAYDHFTDNCTTRVRDLIDEAAGGRVHAALAQPFPRTYRQLALAGFHGRLGMQLGTDFLLGRAVDRPITRWEAAFLPSVLRVSLPLVKTEDGAALAGPPQELYRRRGPPVWTGEPATSGRLLTLAIAGVLLALALAGLRVRRLAAVLQVSWGLLGGLLGCSLSALAAYTTLPLVRQNPNLLLLVPLDLALIGLGAPLTRTYGLVRLLAAWLVYVIWRPPISVFALAVAGVLAAVGYDLRARTQ